VVLDALEPAVAAFAVQNPDVFAEFVRQQGLAGVERFNEAARCRAIAH
jgi:hypothetical protein